MIGRHGEHQRTLPEAAGRIPVPRDRTPGQGVHRRPPRRACDPSRDRRRHASAGARGRRRPPRRGRRDGHGRGLPRLRARERLRIPRRCDPRARLRGARRGDRGQRDLRLRRQQAGFREHPGDLRRRLQRARDRPGLPGLRRYQRHGGARRRRRRCGTLCRHPVPPRERGERLLSGSAERARRPRLPLFAEQPDRIGDGPRQPDALGRVGTQQRCDHPVRCGLRRVHPGPGPATVHLRDPGGARVRDRDAELLEARRLHGRPLRLHRDPVRVHGLGARRRPACPSATSGPGATPRNSTAFRT